MTAISKEAKFRQDSPEIIAAIDTAQDHEWLIVEPYVTRAGIGSQASIIVRSLETGKGWGCVWRAESGRLEGCAGRTFYASRPDSRASKEFLEEFKLRLGCEGATLGVITSGPVSFRAGHRRHLKAEIQRRCY